MAAKTLDEQRAERERLLLSALTSWKLDELRAVQVAWNERSAALPEGGTVFSLLEVVEGLIRAEYDRIMAKR